jgi:hypothetical protein
MNAFIQVLEELTAFKVMHEQKMSKSEELRSELIDQLAQKDAHIQGLQQNLLSSNSEVKFLENQLSSLSMIPMEEIPLDGPSGSQDTLAHELRSLPGIPITRTPSMVSGILCSCSILDCNHKNRVCKSRIATFCSYENF